MKRRQTFMLTILTNAPQQNSQPGPTITAESSIYCGQIKVISSGKIHNFTSIEELNHLIALEMDSPENDPAPVQPSN